MSLPAAVRVLVGSVLVVALTQVPPVGAASARQLPSHDSFYRYSGATPLSKIAPGTVLKTRPMTFSFGGASTIHGEQLLYRTTDQRHRPSVTVTTVLVPTMQPVLTKLVGYLSFYDGLGSKCDPSFTMAGGDGGPAISQQSDEEELLISWYLSQGFTVTIPDFEGTHLHWMAGRESGYGALDGVRATESYLHLTAQTPVALAGYSGGAVAGDWAAELAPTYSPKLDIVGVAIGGVPVDYAHLFGYVNGDPSNSSTMPGILLGLSRAEHLKLRPYLSAYGRRLVADERNVCITSEFGRWPGLRYQKLLRPRYRDIFAVPAFIHLFNRQLMGRMRGHPRMPMFIGNGNVDGTGDGVMRADDVRSLAREYCKQGVTVQYDEYQNANHEEAAAFFEPQTAPFLQERLAGVPVTGNCASIKPGDSIAPLHK